jgi:hypothetical protein
MHVRTARALSLGLALGLVVVSALALLLLSAGRASVQADPACYGAAVWSGTEPVFVSQGPFCVNVPTGVLCDKQTAGLTPTIETSVEACIPD